MTVPLKTPIDSLLIPTIEDDFEVESEESDKEEEQVPVCDGFEFDFDGGFDAKKIENSILLQAKQPSLKSTLDEKIAKKLESLDKVVDSEDEEELEGEDDKVETPKHTPVVVDKMNQLEDIVADKRAATFFEDAPVEEESTETFTSMSISRPILKAIAAMGFVKPTDIQSRTIPLALQGRDICGSAVTGSGKTAAFMIPILERLLFRPKSTPATRVLILVPTRELGAQCHAVALGLSKFSTIQACLCVGGLSNKIQEAELLQKPDIVIATPGRLIDHIHNSKSFSLDQIEILVMDEADRMLEDGFKAELEEIIKHTPRKRQTMLFSATMTDNIDELIKLSLYRPIRLFVDSSQSMTTKLVQEFIRVRGHKEEARPAILAALCARTYKTETLVFFRSKAAAHHMKITFGLLGLKAAELHGNLTQLQRLEALEAFREKKVDFLLATDVASRGLDISGIKTVINYDMPATYQVYVHRCGRTARGDASGRAVSLVGEQDRSILKLALKNSKDAVKHRIVPAPVIAKFEKSIEGLQQTIKEIYEEEKEEKAMSQAEMEMRKAQNRLEFQDEINSRPAKVWFQTEMEKKKEKGTFERLILAPKAVDPTAPKRSKTDGMSRKKKRLYQSRMEDKKENAAQKIAARSAKANSKTKKLTQFKNSDSSNAGSKGGKKRSAFDQERKKPSKKQKQ